MGKTSYLSQRKTNLKLLMNLSENNFCLILAGGVGSRLWPASHELRPKQYMDFSGTGRTMIQQTYDRFRSFLPAEHIFVSTQESYLPLLYENELTDYYMRLAVNLRGGMIRVHDLQKVAV